MKTIITFSLLLLSLIIPAAAIAQEDEELVDFSDRITATCELIGMIALPPEGWFNVPIETPSAELAGCQMMRVTEKDELVGVLRLLSTRAPETTSDPDWFAKLSGVAGTALETMGITIGKPIWIRDDVPVSGPGFESGKAVGFEARIEGNPIPQEVHFLGFGSTTTKYLLTLSTPGREVDGGAYYDRNTADFGALIQNLKLPTAGP